MQPLVALTHARRFQGAAVLVVAAACAWQSREAAAGALWGGALMALHFNLLLIVARYCLRRGPEGSLPAAAALLSSKFCVMAALTAAVLLVLRPHPWGFVAGLATFLVGMAGAAVGHRPSGPHNHHQALTTPSTPSTSHAPRF